MVSLSLLELLRDSHENGLVSFLVGGGGGAATEAAGAGAGGGGCIAEAGGLGLRVGDSAGGGDHGIEGRALVMLLSDIVLLGCSFSVGLFGSLTCQLIGFVGLVMRVGGDYHLLLEEPHRPG